MKARVKILLIGLVMIFVSGELLATFAEAIPLFARRYKISCQVCHVGFPMLNDFGETFAGSGYRFPGEDLEGETVDTGDDKLLLMKHLPLAVRADTFFRVRNDTGTKNDFEFPFGIKLLSSASINDQISYYFYFFFNERGDVSGVEDAFIYLNDAYKGVDLDLRVGQFQVTDVLFAREQRLTFQDFTYYVTAVSDSGFRLTYDRIAELAYNFALTDELGMGIVIAVANGNGIGVANSDRNFDSDNFKNFYGKVSLDASGNSIGFYAYSGRERNSEGIRNEFYRIGPDFSVTLFEDWNVWGNFLFGSDSNPRFVAGPVKDTDSWGGFVGVTRPFLEDWIFSLLYNQVKVENRPELDARTITGNVTYYVMRNFKVMLEVTGDILKHQRGHPVKEHTGVLGVVLAF